MSIYDINIHFHPQLNQPEFSGPSWLSEGVISTGEDLRTRVANLLPHEILSEHSGLSLKNPQLIHFVNEIFCNPQLYALYYNSARISKYNIGVLGELDGFASDSLERGISIVKRSLGYTEIPPFRRLEFLLERMNDGREPTEILLPPHRFGKKPKPGKSGEHTRKMA